MKKNPTIRVMLVDDHPAFRKGLAALIGSEDDMEVVAETGDGREALAWYRHKRPDVVLMDLRLPGLGGVEATLAIRQAFPKARVIVLTTFDLDEDIYRAIQSGAKSYLLKDSSEEELTSTIRAVYADEQELPPKVAARLAARLQRPELHGRELEVLRMLIKGYCNKEMAADLHLSEDTIKAHLKSLFAKLGVRSRTEAAIVAIRHGVIHID